MSYKVIIEPQARKQIDRLDRPVRARILRILEALETDPRPVGVKAMVNRSGQLRVRVGDYRIVYRVEDDRLVVLVLAVGPRGSVYRRF